MASDINFDKYAPIYEECRAKGTLHWDNLDTFCEVLDALEKAGMTVELKKTDKHDCRDICDSCDIAET